MARVNKKVEVKSVPVFTHGGAVATQERNRGLQLRRLVMANMLWEDQFYLDGESTAGLIQKVVAETDPEEVARIAVTARERGKLRHVPLLLVRELARLHSEHVKAGVKGKYLTSGLVADTLEKVIQRPDELAEFLSIYWKDGKVPLSAQVKKGLGRAFGKFNAYSFGKYKGEGDQVKLRDVMFLVHPDPKLNPQGSVGIYRQIANKELETPDTWEVALSEGGDKKEIWTRLLKENKLGGLALLRNLRNMNEAGVEEKYVKFALSQMKTERVLPFRFISAAKHAPHLEPELEGAMARSVENLPKLSGKTVLIVDVSGSMSGGISGKSDLNRLDAAAALSILIRELSEDCRVYCTAGSDYAVRHKTKLIPSRRGFALRDAITSAYSDLGGGGIFLRQVTDYVSGLEKDVERLIVITDEQDTDSKLNPSTANPPGQFNYILNIAAYQNGVGAKGKWDKVDGFSEAVVDYIMNLEEEGLNLKVK